MNQKVSIIIPSYNNISLFKKALWSVLNQDVDNFEVIVSDDSTNDLIKDYCNRLNDNRIIYVKRTNKYGGAIGNWNNGLRNFTGEYIIVLHHDEELGDTHFLSRLLNTFSMGYDLVISDIRVKEGEKQFRRGRINGMLKKTLLAFPVSFFALNPIGPCACIAFSAELLQEFDEHLAWLVDIDWYYRLINIAKRPIFLRKSVINSYSGHQDQITNNINIRKTNIKDSQYLKKKYGSRLINFMLNLNSLYLKLKS